MRNSLLPAELPSQVDCIATLCAVKKVWSENEVATFLKLGLKHRKQEPPQLARATLRRYIRFSGSSCTVLHLPFQSTGQHGMSGGD